MRMRLVVGFILLFFIFLLSRIYYLSIKSNVYYEELAKQNAIKTQLLAPKRGEIFDRNGTLLAVNDLGYSISLKPYLSLKKNKISILEKELNKLQGFFPDLNVTKLLQFYKKNDSYYNQDYIQIVDFIPAQEMMKHYSVLNLDENIKIESAVQRKYPYGKLASHIIGYVGKANLQDIKENEISKLTNFIGKSGIERYYNDILQGVKGEKVYKVNALNQEVAQISYTPPLSNDIHLTIDIELQNFLTNLFENNAGAAIIMDISDGSILAAGSFPEYDLNPFVTGISFKDWDELSNNLDHPFTNKLINGYYPPGSVVKMGVALAFLNSGNITPSTQFFCGGSVELGGRLFRCWNRSGHGNVDLKHAIKSSCDVYFYDGGLQVGINQISQTLSRIGFGAKTGVDLPNEFVGILPSREWKMQRYGQNWFQGDTLNTAIGQGNFLATPMQIARYTAQIAKGKQVLPHFLQSIENNNTKIQNKTHFNQEIFTLFEKSQLPYIRDAMYAVANEQGGTAYRYLHDLKVKVAAKTGTAQVVGFSQTDRSRVDEKQLQYYTRSHAWLTSYAPYANPKYVVTVLLEHGGRDTTSGEISAKIYQKMINLGYFK
ncbi:penicillin-binding protein 2 [Campylobacter sp. LH-2024]|uniref:Penicillin-binding protein 2 n=1 Tax=Campylobacter molothri TaxID=1032242 RepID=A0ACC5W337_9BACT|nr:penicillin-binding protein 2 [Campylobacter sp. RM10537]MBZ7928843.1 penicillin-binding protein 2 [Campylobacter sp. RM10542]MBZ7930200.1 penicillin-binding protein 2 [Campylobacter sp. W0067]MBZ7931450.1 penicillin-binding protein 2 [Campylobacter sp. RM12910]MBZ7933212.1 penicillin-binding protein 2 [Campylobacter sp. RM10543]MBZ7934664.1 penicillin-binding protein 2 [Campylobacter sp. W0065]MBZ7937628.1 penicillin-binding protein 2 [Campylobacter sp. RM10538]MBZ7941037.1 penicillin-bin